MADTQLQQLAKTDRNQFQERDYQNLLKQAGIQFELQDGKAFVPGFGLGGNEVQDVSFFDPFAVATRGNQTSFDDLVKKTLGLYKEANQPAVEAIKASIPTTEATFAQRQTQLEGQRQPLKDRYSLLLDEIKRKEGVETESAKLRRAREFSKRGIPLSSGMFEEDIAETTRPIGEFFTNQFRDVGLAGEEALRSLENLISGIPLEKQSSLDAINQAIANLLSGGNQNAIQTALSQYQLQQQAAQQASQLALQRKIAEDEQGYRNRLLESVEIPKTQAAILQSQRPSTSLNDLMSLFGIG